MRAPSALLVLTFAGIVARGSAASAAETTRVLRAEIPATAGAAFAVENLAGRMTVRVGSGDRVVVVATVHAESGDLASRFRLDTLNEGGMPTVRVRYPDGEDDVRYRAPSREEHHALALDFFSHSESRVRYDGRVFYVSSGRGRAMHVDLAVELPAGESAGTFRVAVGLLDASDVSGRLSFETRSADLDLHRLRGAVRVHSSSGDTRAEEIHGDWSSEVSSGDISLEGLTAGAADFRSGSGDVRASGLEAARLSLETGSGDYRISDTDVGELTARTGSGDIVIEARGARLASFRAHSGSGDIVLRLPREASFDAHARLSSGDMRVHFSDGTATRRHDEMVAYRRGDGATKIDVDAGSGDFTIEPR
ncbi:MAG: DUF4097 family beta strand repeat-containing protein [Acidobacteriota bacterium]